MSGRAMAACALAAALAAPVARGDDGPRRIPWEFLQSLGGGAYLGVQLEDVVDGDTNRPKLRDVRGAIVSRVERGSPAEEAGVREGDVITSFDGERVRSAMQLTRLVRETPVGRKVDLEVSRGGARQTLSVELGERPRRDGEMVLPVDPPRLRELREPRGLRRPAPRLGIGYRDVTDADVARLRLPKREGVLVTGVEPETPAARAGIQVDDVVIAIGGDGVPDGSFLRARVQRLHGRATIAVIRKGETREMEVQFDGDGDVREF